MVVPLPFHRRVLSNWKDVVLGFIQAWNSCSVTLEHKQNAFYGKVAVAKCQSLEFQNVLLFCFSDELLPGT